MAKKKIDSWEDCPRCSKIPSSYSSSMFSEDGDGEAQAPEMMELPGMSEVDMGSGYQEWVVKCDICGTRYYGEIDVEPFVWDFTFKRENNGMSYSQFGKKVDLDTVPIKKGK
jgi:hypothetical protein